MGAIYSHFQIISQVKSTKKSSKNKMGKKRDASNHARRQDKTTDLICFSLG